jgi:hypothetical protein
MKTIRNILFLVVVFLIAQTTFSQNKTIIISDADSDYLEAGSSVFDPGPGDIIKVDASRTKSIKIVGMEGTKEQPITIINDGGQVHIQTANWGAIELKNCKHVVVSGRGDPNYRYGFILEGTTAGLGITELCSDITVEFVEIGGVFTPGNYNEWSFFGIVAKKDFAGNPPTPYPQFNNLIIHDTYIHDVHEGMYLGETKSPGMEFRGMRVYNNVVINTFREAIQIANSVQDVEIYNNILKNSGRDDDFAHGNSLQIGDNSQTKIYNNILIECPIYGVIVFGTGQIEISNNYFENTRGIFSDDRKFIFDDAEMHINNNYFKDTKIGDSDYQIIKYYNQFMDLYVSNNTYDTPDEILDWGFINYIKENPAPMLIVNNIFSEVSGVSYQIIDGVFSLDATGPVEYLGMGPLSSSPQEPEISRIILNKRMIDKSGNKKKEETGEVLVDEQKLEPNIDKNPKSKSWKPKKDKGKKHKKNEISLFMDLGNEYFIDEIYFHHRKKKGKITLSYLSEGEWIGLFTDDGNKNNQWSQHLAQITTTEICLTVDKKYKGEVNEIALYGYETSGMKSGYISEPIRAQSKVIHEESLVKIYPNPASNFVNIQSTIDNIQNDILDYQGRVVLTSREKLLNVSDLANGIYILRTKNLDDDNIQLSRLIINH